MELSDYGYLDHRDNFPNQSFSLYYFACNIDRVLKFVGYSSEKLVVMIIKTNAKDRVD